MLWLSLLLLTVGQAQEEELFEPAGRVLASLTVNSLLADPWVKRTGFRATVGHQPHRLVGWVVDAALYPRPIDRARKGLVDALTFPLILDEPIVFVAPVASASGMVQLTPFVASAEGIHIVPRFSIGPTIVFDKEVSEVMEFRGDGPARARIGGSLNLNVDLHLTQAVALRMGGGGSVWSSSTEPVVRLHVDAGLAFAIPTGRVSP